MSKSAQKRSNRSARLIAAQITLPEGACVAFGPAEARAFALAMKIDVPTETNLSLLADLLNRRMPKRFPGKARTFAPYADTFRPEYREPNHDFIRPRRDAETRLNFSDPSMSEAW